MKRMTQTVLAATAALAAYAGFAQAGRSSDYLVTQQKGAAIERAGDAGGVAYTGRPSDTAVILPARSGETAEFAVMEVQGGDAVRGAGAYYGSRPFDNPTR